MMTKSLDSATLLKHFAALGLTKNEERPQAASQLREIGSVSHKENICDQLPRTSAPREHSWGPGRQRQPRGPWWWHS
eukprot:4633066-Karenia_brevis.AAC.1